jgi:hypothetical protein
MSCKAALGLLFICNISLISHLTNRLNIYYKRINNKQTLLLLTYRLSDSGQNFHIEKLIYC